MSVTVTKDGPYFSSGSISFSQLRQNFKETTSGSVSAAELIRDTNVNNENPIVPDSSENTSISSGSNLKLSQFRNSIKRYYATQSGTDIEFRCGRFDGTRGIDWSGGGVNGPDGGSGGTSGNITKNVQKKVIINGTCGSLYRLEAAVQLAPITPVYNVSFEIYGEVYGAGGFGGYESRGYPYGNQSGQDGGMAINVQYDNGGNISPVYIGPNAKVWGGGGGGEQGQNGERGSTGTCVQDYTVQACGQTPNCSSGGSIISQWSGNCCESYSVGFPPKERCGKWLQYATCRITQGSNSPTQGIGGRGGNGIGYSQSRTNGENGSTGTCPSCPGGFYLSGGSCATNGKRGGDGGDWGQDGGETTGNATRGRGGAAIAGSSYRVYGYVNSTTLKGAYNA